MEGATAAYRALKSFGKKWPRTRPALTLPQCQAHTDNMNIPALNSVAIILALACVGCGSGQASAPNAPATAVTASSLADVARRLELRGYSYERQFSVLGQDFVTYTKKTSDADYTAEIGRWIGDQRLREIAFACKVNQAAFDSDAARVRIAKVVREDALAIIRGREDYLRAVRDLKKSEDEGLPRFEGHATTAEGWRIRVVEYAAYYGRERSGNAILLGTITLTHLNTSEDVPAFAVQEFNREVNKARGNRD